MSVGDYLFSTRNLAGLAAGSLAGAATAAVPGAPIWPLAAVGAYGLGAALIPGRRKRTARPSQQPRRQWTAHELQAHLGWPQHDLPAGAVLALGDITNALPEILQRWRVVSSVPQTAHDVSMVVLEWVPDALERYRRLPADVRASPNSEGRTAHDLLIDQLSLIADRLICIRDAAYAADLRELDVQGRMLQDKFGPNPLDL